MTSEATNAQQAHGTVSTERTRKPSTILVVAAFAAFLATFNETFLNVGFAPIMESLSVDVSTVQWLATAYMLGAAVMVPVSAFAYRSFPTRQLFCATTALLVIGSVIGALAPNFSVLFAGRIVQALGTGMLIPIGMNITLEVAPREKLGTYMGIMGASAIDAMSAGMLASGVLIGIVALVGFALALWIRSNAKKPVSVAPQAQEGAWAGDAQAAAATAASMVSGANTLAQIMKTDVYTLPEDSTVLDAMKLFMERGISGVPVVDSKLQVVGFISDGDVMASLADQVPAFKSAWSFIVERENEDFDRTLNETMNMNIGELSRKKVISVNVDDDLGEVTRVLSENHLKKAPVLDGDKIVGIINRSNITKYAIDQYLAQNN